MFKRVIALLRMRKCSDFKYSDVKMFLLKLGSKLQNLLRYENFNKLQTAFPQSGIFPQSGMYRGCLLKIAKVENRKR